MKHNPVLWTYMYLSHHIMWCHEAFHRHDDVIKWKHSPHHWPLREEFPGHRWILLTEPVTRSFDVFFHPRLNKRLIKQSWGWWFETPSRSLWRHCDGRKVYKCVYYLRYIPRILHTARALSSVNSNHKGPVTWIFFHLMTSSCSHNISTVISPHFPAHHPSLLYSGFIMAKTLNTQIAKFIGPTWVPPGSCRPQMGPVLAPWTLLSG